MGRKYRRPFFLMVGLCSAAGVILGGTSSWAESNQCIQTDAPTAACLTQTPLQKTIEGMSVGLVAGVGAAVCATFQAQQGKGAK